MGHRATVGFVSIYCEIVHGTQCNWLYNPVILLLSAAVTVRLRLVLFFRFSLLKRSADRNFIDGLNSLHYKPPIITQTRFYTNITVDLRPVKDINPSTERVPKQ